MTSIRRSALVEFSAEQMFDLVNDIERYPEFMPGCKAARVISAGDSELVGELSLARAGISQRFTTRNRLQRPHSIGMSLVAGNFSHFAAEWRFEPLSDSACKISFDMTFEFKSGLVERAAQGLFSRVADKMVDAIVARARQCYA